MDVSVDVIGCQEATIGREKTMPKHKYQIFSHDLATGDAMDRAEEKLNSMDESGWETVSMSVVPVSRHVLQGMFLARKEITEGDKS